MKNICKHLGLEMSSQSQGQMSGLIKASAWYARAISTLTGNLGDSLNCVVQAGRESYL